MPSTRRMLTLGGSALVGIAAAATMFAAPASAHTASIDASACKAGDNAWTVTWTVSNDYKYDVKLTGLKAEPKAIDGIADNAKVPAHKSIKGTQQLTGEELEK